MLVLRKVYNIVVDFVLGVVVVLFLLFTVPGMIGFTPYVVTSGSMRPEYPVGSLIYVKDVDANEVCVGDAITFYMEGSEIVATHQVYEIDINNKHFLTQGINNRDKEGNIIPDASPVKFSSLIGKPVLCVPFLGYINTFCTTPPGKYVIFGVSAVLLASSFFTKTKSKKSEKIKK